MDNSEVTHQLNHSASLLVDLEPGALLSQHPPKIKHRGLKLIYSILYCTEFGLLRKVSAELLANFGFGSQQNEGFLLNKKIVYRRSNG